MLSVSAATNCRYFFMRVVWSTTVGLGAGAGTKAMAAAVGWVRVAVKMRQTLRLLLLSIQLHVPYDTSALENNNHPQQMNCIRQD